MTDKQLFKAGVKQYLALKHRKIVCKKHPINQIELVCPKCIVKLMFYFEDMAVLGLQPEGVVLIRREVGPKPLI